MRDHDRCADIDGGLVWRTAQASQSSQGCVEVAWLSDGRVGVRDSKDRAKPPLVFDSEAWAGLLRAAKNGEFDR